MKIKFEDVLLTLIGLGASLVTAIVTDIKVTKTLNKRFDRIEQRTNRVIDNRISRLEAKTEVKEQKK